MIDVVYWLRGNSHDELCEISKRSVKKAYGDTAQIHEYRDAEAEPKMLANVRCQLHHLMHTQYARPVLFLDADTLVLKPLPDLGSTDLLVTWRDKVNGEENQITALMPYNYGVVGAVATPASIEAWMWMYNRICHMGDGYQDWYGNQLALAELVGARAKTGKIWRVAAIRWAYEGRFKPTEIGVMQAPCEQYNYTPEVGDDVSDKYILHFKGDRKDMMLSYAKELGL